jgi:hypothetical protein
MPLRRRHFASSCRQSFFRGLDLILDKKQMESMNGRHAVSASRSTRLVLVPFSVHLLNPKYQGTRTFGRARSDFTSRKLRVKIAETACAAAEQDARNRPYFCGTIPFPSVIT